MTLNSSVDTWATGTSLLYTVIMNKCYRQLKTRGFDFTSQNRKSIPKGSLILYNHVHPPASTHDACRRSEPKFPDDLFKTPQQFINEWKVFEQHVPFYTVQVDAEDTSTWRKAGRNSYHTGKLQEKHWYDLERNERVSFISCCVYMHM